VELSRRRILGWAFPVGIIAVFLVTIGYIWMLRSESYRVADSYVQDNAAIRQYLGGLCRTILVPFNFRSKTTAFTEESGQRSSEGIASCMILAIGASRSGLVTVRMTMRDGRWSVLKATLYVWKGPKVDLSGQAVPRSPEIDPRRQRISGTFGFGALRPHPAQILSPTDRGDLRLAKLPACIRSAG
jgi:hypothetical protein